MDGSLLFGDGMEFTSGNNFVVFSWGVESDEKMVQQGSENTAKKRSDL